MSNRNCITNTLAIVLVVLAASRVLARDQVTQEAAQNPKIVAPNFIFPRISDHGKVVRLPNALDQPRDNSKICVDVTAGGPWDKINPAIEKVARFVNIYAGAGSRSAKVRITVILHGKATLTALNSKAYAAKFGTDDNPNLRLCAKLKEAGVELLVCGQSLTHKSATLADVADEVGVAVSALTVNVNRQTDGYAFIPLH